MIIAQLILFFSENQRSILMIMGMFGPWQILLLLLAVGAVVLPIVALIDIVKSELEGSAKLLWILLVLFIPIAGSFIYFASGRDKKIG